MSDVEVRAARVADEAAVLALARDEMAAQETMDPRFGLRPDAAARYALYLRDRMKDIDSSVFVALLDGVVVGVAVASLRSQESLFELRRYGYISDLMVLPAARRRGVGRKFYDRLALWFRGLGIHVIRLHVAVRSDGARAFWKSVGAEEFLTEAWIDLAPQEVPGAASPEAAEPAPETPAPAAEPTPETEPAAGRPEFGPGT